MYKKTITNYVTAFFAGVSTAATFIFSLNGTLSPAGIVFASILSLSLAAVSVYLIYHNISNIKRLQKIRSDFVSNVTHELKTPLTSIKGFIDTLKDGAIGDETVAERFLDIIEIETDRLISLINDVLQLSEIETMKQDTHISDYLLADLVKDVSTIIDLYAQKKGVTFTCQISDSIGVVRANPDRIKQLLINLLDNAVKYNKPNGSVKLECQRDGNNIIFVIKDTGIGIPDEQIPRLFERFYRIDKGRSRDNGGTGLGLSIVKHIANLYNGEVLVVSTVGVGSTFFVKLPIAVS